MDINSYLSDLKLLNSELELRFFDTSENVEVTSLQELLDRRFKRITNRLSGNLQDHVGFTLKNTKGTIFTIEVGEYYPCCGKVIGKQLYARRQFFGMDEHIIEKLNEIFTIFINIVESVLKHCKYSSFSMIVSKPEQEVFYDLMSKQNTYKIVNQFENQRMPNKNLCLEFCKNLW